MEQVGLLGVEEEVEAEACTAGPTGRAGVVRVVVVALSEPVNQAVSPWRGRMPIDAARPWAHSRRATLIDPQLREGCTRLVSRIANDRDVKSMTIDVPV